MISDWIIKGAVALALVAGLIFGYAQWADHQQDVGYQKAVAEFQKQENADLKAAMRETIRLNQVIEEARHAAEERDKDRQRLADRVDTLNGQLRNTERSINSLVSRASADSLREATLSFSGLFAACRDEYVAMGKAASGHSGDVRTLSESWPRSVVSE